MVRELQAAHERGLDWETDGLRYANGRRPIGASLGYLDREGRPHCWYVPWGHKTPETQVPEAAAKQVIRDGLRGARAVINHNLKFELQMSWAWLGTPELIPLDVQLHDTLIQAFLNYENRQSFKLDDVAADELSGTLPWNPHQSKEMVDELLRQRAKARRMPYKKDKPGQPAYLSLYGHSEIPVAIEGEYGCRDVAMSLLLDRAQRPKAQGAHLGEWQSARAVLYQNEMLLVRALAEMEYVGQPCNASYLRGLAREIDEELDRRRRELSATFHIHIDWSNDNELRDFIYGHLKLPVKRRTDRGLASVETAALQDAAIKIPQLEQVIEYGYWDKARTTYTDSLAEHVCADGRLHPGFLQFGAATGRLASESPNLQNIPTRHKETAKRIRKAFGVRPGQRRVYLDYSQVELRMLGWITGAPAFVNAYRLDCYDRFRRGELSYEQYTAIRRTVTMADIHSAVTKAVFGIDESHLDWKRKRRAAKVINFGIPYGGGLDMLTGNPELRIEHDEAKAYLSAYRVANPEIEIAKRALFEGMLRRKSTSFINWAGRTRHGPGLRSGDENAAAATQRAMFASWVQGSAAELTRFSLVRLMLLRKVGQLPAYSTSTVHDEIQLDCDEADVPVVVTTARKAMEDYPYFGGIPIIAEVESTTTNWAEKAKWETTAN